MMKNTGLNAIKFHLKKALIEIILQIKNKNKKCEAVV